MYIYDGIVGIERMTKNEHIHIFSTPNATNIKQDVIWMNIDMKTHLVPTRKQSLDMHLVSYLGYLLGIYGNECSYVIVSKDKDYDNIIKFWNDKGYSNVVRRDKLYGNMSNRTLNFVGEDRSELNTFVQRNLSDKQYDGNTINRICKLVIAHCNDEKVSNEIHNDLRGKFEDYSTVYKDVKCVLQKFIALKNEQ